MSNDSIITPENFYGHDQIDKLLDQIKSQPLSEATVSDGDEPRVDYDYRVCKIFKIPIDVPDFSWMYDVMKQKTSEINERSWRLPIKQELTELQFVEYTTGSHFEWHTDSLDIGPKSKRRISVVIQLSDPDDYSGGEVQVRKEQGGTLTLPKHKGATILFSSDDVEHRVTHLTKGTRRSLVSWVCI